MSVSLTGAIEFTNDDEALWLMWAGGIFMPASVDFLTGVYGGEPVVPLKGFPEDVGYEVRQLTTKMVVDRHPIDELAEEHFISRVDADRYCPGGYTDPMRNYVWSKAYRRSWLSYEEIRDIKKKHRVAWDLRAVSHAMRTLHEMNWRVRLLFWTDQ